LDFQIRRSIVYLEPLESRTFFSADVHTVSVPFHGSAEGNLPGNSIVGNLSHLGRFKASFNAQGLLIITAANGDELWAAAAVTPTPDPAVLHVEGEYVGGTGRFEGAHGTFSHDVNFVDAQGNFVYSLETTLTLQRPWKNQA
jgi:hypothetical protein